MYAQPDRGIEMRGSIVIDTIDLAILDYLHVVKSSNMSNIKLAAEVTYSNLLPHVMRLYELGFIEYEKEKQTKWVSLTRRGKEFRRFFYSF